MMKRGSQEPLFLIRLIPNDLEYHLNCIGDRFALQGDGEGFLI